MWFAFLMHKTSIPFFAFTLIIDIENADYKFFPMIGDK
jgi:hypothetical protein